MSETLNCPSCSEIAAEMDRFCRSCGAPLRGDASDGRSSRPALDKLFAHLRSGEQRPATIMMADLAGYTALGEGSDPEWVFHLLNEVFHELVECVVAHDGHVDKYVGDELVALFGVPLAQERSVERAVRAALAMRERLEAINRQNRFGGIDLAAHIGINMGPVMVGPVGHHAYADYTVIGDTVNVAKRLEEEAPTGEIYVSEAVWQAASELFDWDTVGPLSLAGRQRQVMVYRVIGARKPASYRSSGHIDQIPFLGQEDQLTALDRLAEEVVTGRQTAVCVSGPAGIGKSCFIDFWTSRKTAHPYRVLALTCFPFGQHFPLLPILDLVAHLLGLHLEDWPARVIGDPQSALSQFPIEETSREALAHFLASGLAIEEQTDDLKKNLGAGLRELLEREAKTQPLCLVIEDTQWMDDPTREVLADIFAALDNCPILFLLSSREPEEGWAEKQLHAQVIRLTPLPHSTIETLIQAWAVPHKLPARTVKALIDRSQGHPYFAHELTLGLHQSRRHEAADASLPGTLQELFLSQLDQLPRALRHLVQSASVVGEPLACNLLQATMGSENPLTPALVDEAVRYSLLRSGPAPGQYVFARRLLFEAAYTTIPPSQRKELHSRMASYLVTNMELLGEVTLHSAAHHAYLGWRDEQALELLLKSAKRYRSQYGTRLAIQDASRALEVISSLAHPEEFLDQRLEALLFLSQSCEIVGELAQAEGALSEAEILAEDSSNAELVAQIATSAATLNLMQGSIAEAEKRFHRAVEAWRELGNHARIAHGLLGLGLCARETGQSDRALQLFTEAARMSTDALWVQAAALNNAGILLLEQGDLDRAEGFLLEGLCANESEGDRRGIAHCKASLGELYLRMGKTSEAQLWLEQANREAAEIEDVDCMVLAGALFAQVLVLQDQPQSAREVLRKCEGVSAATTDRHAREALELAQLETRRAFELVKEESASS